MATKQQQFGVVEGTLVYVKVAEPSLKYQSKDQEYSVSIIVDEDAADTWDEVFSKQPAKKVKVADFEAKYKIPCPIEGVKNVYEIKLKKDATKDGEPFYPEHRPRVFLDGNDGERTDITESRLVANGSVGKVSYRISSNDFGTFAKLNNVLILENDFIEYVSTGGGKAGAEFGDKPIKTEAPRKEATEARATKEASKEKPVKKAKAPEPEDDDTSDAPF